jgi:hypothetical protein
MRQDLVQFEMSVYPFFQVARVTVRIRVRVRVRVRVKVRVTVRMRMRSD